MWSIFYLTAIAFALSVSLVEWMSLVYSLKKKSKERRLHFLVGMLKAGAFMMHKEVKKQILQVDLWSQREITRFKYV